MKKAKAEMGKTGTVPPNSGRVLIVDPDVANRQTLLQRLGERGFRVDEAATREDAYERARVWFPQVIVLDASLGPDTCLDLRRNPVTAHVPVVFHSFQPVEDSVAVAGLSAGANDFLVQPYSPALLAARVSSQVAIYKTQMALRERVLRDELTGVFSRRYLFESMRQHVSQFSRPGPPVIACLMVDVDHFKSVNDRLGHLEGDRWLKKVAGMIYAMTRKGDVVARFGGEEFVVILPATSADGAALVAEKLRTAVESDCGAENITISVGVSWHETRVDDDWEGPGDEEIINLLLARADEALYRAKADGRNCVRMQSEYTGSERRRHPRVDLPMTVTLRTASGSVLERRAHVSAGGLAVAETEEVKVGDAVDVTLNVGEPVHVSGVVVWIRVGDRCGVAFQSFEGNGQELLIRFLGHRTRVSRRRL